MMTQILRTGFNSKTRSHLLTLTLSGFKWYIIDNSFCKNKIIRIWQIKIKWSSKRPPICNPASAEWIKFFTKRLIENRRRLRNNVKISDFTLLKQKKFFLKLFWILGATYTVHNIKDHVDTYFTYPSIVTRRTLSNGKKWK